MSGLVPLRVVLVGGSGFLGSAVRSRLVDEGHDVTVIGRAPTREHDRWRQVNWDARTIGDWADSLDGADAIMHLAGKRVDCRPTARNIDALIASRVDTVRLVGEAVQRVAQPPAAWVQLSSLAIFGDCGDRIIDESTPVPATGLRQQVEVCRLWEEAFRDVTGEIGRTVLLRPGIGIGGVGDPASAQLARLARFGLGGSVAGGRQWVSWIRIDDFVDLLCRSITDTDMKGLYHLSSPNPVRNAAFMAAYRDATGRKFGLPAPRLITQIGATLLGSDPALALTGRRCVPTRLLEEGYCFAGDDIDDAVQRAVHPSR